MKAAVVPAVSSSWQIKDVPQPQPGPNLCEALDVVARGNVKTIVETYPLAEAPKA